MKQNKHKHANLTGAEGVALHKPGVCEAKHAKKKFWLKPQRRVTDFTGTEGKALHKPDVCEAKHAKQKLLNKAKYNTRVQQTLWEPRE